MCTKSQKDRQNLKNTCVRRAFFLKRPSRRANPSLDGRLSNPAFTFFGFMETLFIILLGQHVTLVLIVKHMFDQDPLSSWIEPLMEWQMPVSSHCSPILLVLKKPADHFVSRFWYSFVLKYKFLLYLLSVGQRWTSRSPLQTISGLARLSNRV